MANVYDECPYFEEKCKNEKCECAKYLAYKDVKVPGTVERVLKEKGFDINSETFELLMSMQKSFAGSLHKVDDLTKDEMDLWINRYLVCIEDEVRELREHLNCYRTIEGKKDIELKKEVIDILHFVMDVFISGGATHEDIKKYFYKDRYNICKENDFLKELYNGYKVIGFKEKDDNDDTILKLSCILLDACGSVRQQITWKHWKKPNDEINKHNLYNSFINLLIALMNLFKATMEFDEIKNIYITKNVENILRQVHNY